MNVKKHHRQGRQKSWIAVAALFAVALSAQRVPTFHAGVFLVHVDAEVLERNNRPLPGLTKEDFRVLDGGQEQTIVSFSQTEQPLDLILLFDISGSMQKKVREVSAAAHEGLEELRPGDRVSVMVFSTKARVVAPFSVDFGEVERAIHRVLAFDFRGQTRIQDSIHEASNCFLQDKVQGHRRRAVLVVTDNFGRPSHRKTSILQNLWEAEALVCGLVVPNPAAKVMAPLSGAVPGRIGGMEDLVEKTGGDIIHSGHLERTFPEMMHRIRSRYTLYYRLPAGEVGSFRTIDVQLSERGRQHFPRARVLAQRGYRLQERDHYGLATRE